MNAKGRLQRLLPKTVVRWLLKLPPTVVNVIEGVRRVPWPNSLEGWPSESSPRVAVLTVSYNTLLDTAHLLFSLFRVLEVRLVPQVVIVDNGSTDGSELFLEQLDRRGMIRLVRNWGAPRHGPGLNRGMNHLARAVGKGQLLVDYVWVIDSDVVVLRPDTLRAAIDSISEAQAAVAGPFLFDVPSLPEGHAHVSSNLVDPRRVWRRGIAPFRIHGSPAARMQRDLRDRGERIINFPYYEKGYLLHLWGATRAALAAGKGRQSRHYHPPDRLAGGQPWHMRFLKRFDAELPDLDPDRFVEVCGRDERVDVWNQEP